MAVEHKDFVERCKEVAKKLGSVGNLAKAAGIPEATIRSWFRSERAVEPSRDKLIAVALGGGVTVEWLATGAGPMIYPSLRSESRADDISPIQGHLHDTRLPKPLDVQMLEACVHLVETAADKARDRQIPWSPALRAAMITQFYYIYTSGKPSHAITRDILEKLNENFPESPTLDK